ncbi:hypothetical protein BGX26_005287 [Mortierella sp. AD094]|nr:hypothetical protein BGX26_005287 [Mortierella sp. AD094]
MKAAIVFTALAAVVSTVSSYQCPAPSDVDYACKQLNVFPLVCYNPHLNVDACNAKQCNQPYLDNYAACQCCCSVEQFYENSKNVQGMINRCGGNLNNPFGSPDIYRSGQGTATSPPATDAATPSATPSPATTDPAVTSTASASDGSDTRVYDGTTYYGGVTGVVDGTTRIVSATAVVGATTILPGTTTWVSETPGIISGTSTFAQTSTQAPPAATSAPATAPSAQPISAFQKHPYEITDHHISGGSIAGIVLGLLGSFILAILLGCCWRKVREERPPMAYAQSHVPSGPTRTTVVEKIEPVVVRAVPN